MGPPAAARDEKTRTLRTDEALEATLDVSRLSSEQLQTWSNEKGVPSAQAQVLTRALAELGRAEATRGELAKLQSERDEVEARQQRLHRHQKQLKEGAKEAAAPIVARLIELEDALVRIDSEKQRVEERLRTEHEAVARVFENLPTKG
jgi:hypothetical protein